MEAVPRENWIGLIEDRFEDLSSKTLVRDEKIVQRYRFLPMKTDASQRLTGLGTGQGTWGASNLAPSKCAVGPGSANGKALAVGEPEGFVKIIIGERDPHAKGNLSTVNSSVSSWTRRRMNSGGKLNLHNQTPQLVDWSVNLG